MIKYSEAVDILRREAAHLKAATETVTLSEINGRIAAANITSPLSIPSFDNSSMDGFAVRAADFKADGTTLRLKGSLIAGDGVGDIEVSTGTCCEIMTGAPVPKGADSIVPVELITRTGEMINFTSVPKREEFIRRIGSDFMRGAPVVAQGDLLGVQHILPLAALGVGKIEVYAKPKIAFIPTGREIVDSLDQNLAEGQIYNSSLPYTQAFLARAGAEVLLQPTIADDPAAFQQAVKKLMQDKVTLILSSGAVSAGSHDFIRSGLEALGATILFHKVAIKPAKPVLFAVLPNGTLYLGLPGNPVSTAVGLRFFVCPLLAALMQQKPERPFFTRVTTPLARKPALWLFLKAKIDVSTTGVLEAQLLDGQESYKTSPFLGMNGWAVIPEDKTAVEAGEIIEVFPLDRLS